MPASTPTSTAPAAPHQAQPHVVTEPLGDVQADGPWATGQQLSEPTTRRGVVKLLALTAAVAASLPWRWAYAKKVGLSLAQVGPLQQVGGSTLVKIKGQELLLIRDTETTVKALDPMCTHKKCKVFYRPKNGDIGCKCHKSKFTLDGVPVSGPAPKPLGRFPAKIKGDKIIIDLG